MDNVILLLTDSRFSLVLSPIVTAIYLSLIIIDIVEHNLND